MADLFARAPLEQNTGVIAERWGQDGSTPVNVSVSYTLGGATIHTTSVKKVFYVTHIFINNNAASADEFTLTDGLGGPTRLAVTMEAVIGWSDMLVFSTPLIFDNLVRFDRVSGTIDVNITLVGWEEDER